jgi:hypothetical protein
VVPALRLFDELLSEVVGNRARVVDVLAWILPNAFGVRIDDDRAIESAVDVLFQRERVAVIEVRAGGLGEPFVRE